MVATKVQNDGVARTTNFRHLYMKGFTVQYLLILLRYLELGVREPAMSQMCYNRHEIFGRTETRKPILTTDIDSVGQKR